MNNERLSLLSNIQHIFNENQLGSVDYELSRFFLQNYADISKMNIYEIAEENHVSRATVRRFCDRLGYENFKDLKKHFDDFNEGTEKYRRFYSGDDFRKKIVMELDSMMQELSERMNTPEKNSIVSDMETADTVFIFSSSRISSSVLTFQHELINFGLTIRVADNLENIELLESQMTDKSLIIIFSITGVFVESIKNGLDNCRGRKILFTLERNVIFNRTFDKVYHFRKQGNSKINEQLYYTYGVDFIFDILFKDYLDFIYEKKEV